MNNKGFAITTVLYGTFILFLALILTMLAITSNYKDKMEMLIENTNGARDIVDLYDAGSWLLKIGNRNFYKTNDGLAIIVYMDFGYAHGPVLISKSKEAVSFSTDCTGKECYDECPLNDKRNRSVCDTKDDYYVMYNGVKYYYSSPNLWASSPMSSLLSFKNIDVDMSGATGNVPEILKRYKSAVLTTLQNKVKYYD